MKYIGHWKSVSFFIVKHFSTYIFKKRRKNRTAAVIVLNSTINGCKWSSGSMTSISIFMHFTTLDLLILYIINVHLKKMTTFCL